MDKEKFTLEFPIQCSPKMLYRYIETPSGLGEWFADNVNGRTERFTFEWDGDESVAVQKAKKADKFVRYQWEDDEDTDYYFEFRIVVDDLTKDVSLVVTDFAEEDETDEAKMLWEKQIDQLKHTIGS